MTPLDALIAHDHYMCACDKPHSTVAPHHPHSRVAMRVLSRRKRKKPKQKKKKRDALSSLGSQLQMCRPEPSRALTARENWMGWMLCEGSGERTVRREGGRRASDAWGARWKRGGEEATCRKMCGSWAKMPAPQTSPDSQLPYLEGRSDTWKSPNWSRSWFTSGQCSSHHYVRKKFKKPCLSYSLMEPP